MNKINNNHQQIFQKITQQFENSVCFECESPNPVWTSVNNGIFICFQCSGLHRSFGVNYSFVRSTTIDNWSNLQLQNMILGGNLRLKRFMEENNIIFDKNDILSKYKTIECEKYREKLKETSEEVLKNNNLICKLEVDEAAETEKENFYFFLNN